MARAVSFFASAVVSWGDGDTPDRPHFHASNMELVGHVPTGTTVADVWVHRAHAYLGSRACGEGVSIIDATDPAQGALCSTCSLFVIILGA